MVVGILETPRFWWTGANYSAALLDLSSINYPSVTSELGRMAMPAAHAVVGRQGVGVEAGEVAFQFQHGVHLVHDPLDLLALAQGVGGLHQTDPEPFCVRLGQKSPAGGPLCAQWVAGVEIQARRQIGGVGDLGLDVPHVALGMKPAVGPAGHDGLEGAASDQLESLSHGGDRLMLPAVAEESTELCPVRGDVRPELVALFSTLALG